eukprot:3843480-Amphidinium_carterae.1
MQDCNPSPLEQIMLPRHASHIVSWTVPPLHSAVEENQTSRHLPQVEHGSSWACTGPPPKHCYSERLEAQEYSAVEQLREHQEETIKRQQQEPHAA